MAVNEEDGRLDRESKYYVQLKCRHKWGEWELPYWDPRHKYRVCTECDKYDRQYLPDMSWRNGSIDDRM